MNKPSRAETIGSAILAVLSMAAMVAFTALMFGA